MILITRLSSLIACFLCGMGLLPAGETIQLIPNATLQFEFSDLPETLLSMSSGDQQPANLTAQLPENYSTEVQFPLFVYLTGSEGGRGTSVGMARKVIGPRDFISVQMPLFKRRVDPTEPARGLMISMDDADVLSRGFSTMLGKLMQAVPNITPERSTLGGFSNGAHATGVMLAAQDEFTLQHFRQFYLLEGGTGPLMANVLQKNSLKPCRFLLLFGDRKPTPNSIGYYEIMAQLVGAAAKSQKLDFTVVAMRGYGHEEPPPYFQLIAQWTRGEPLTEVPPKPESK